MHKIDYDILLTNIDKMINLLEFDGLRSAGKIKLNSSHLIDLYALRDRYTAKIARAKTTVSKKED